MKSLLENELYCQDIHEIADDSGIDWNYLNGATILLSGASGMIGSFLIDVLLTGKESLGCKVIALVRDEDRAKKRFAAYQGNSRLQLVKADINQGLFRLEESVDFVIHAASNTHPRAYASKPIETLITNITGTEHLLQVGMRHGMKRFLFLSSVEVYGENKRDVEKFAEDYCGYIDCNTLRACYPEGKRAGEALCQAYRHEKGTDIVLPRLSRTYGPTMLLSDSKAISQFIKNGIAGQDIVLKSKGDQLYSYSYVADAVSGILYCLVKGEQGEAYNIADDASDVTLAELAKTIAEQTGGKVIFELPDAVEQAGFSKATKALLDSRKLQSLGWRAKFVIKKGLEHTIRILQDVA